MAGGPRHRPGRPGPAASLTAALAPDAAARRGLALAGILLMAIAGRALLSSMLGEPVAGLGFAVALLAIALPARPHLGNLRPWPLLAGIALGLALLLPGLWLRVWGLPPRMWFIAPQALLGYSAALVVIAPAEEVFLRGLLQPALRAALGPAPAIAVVALLFAAIHVPAYGPTAVPLDLGVGILFGWLRERSGSTAACGLAHLIADLGSWWLP